MRNVDQKTQEVQTLSIEEVLKEVHREKKELMQKIMRLEKQTEDYDVRNTLILK